MPREEFNEGVQTVGAYLLIGVMFVIGLVMLYVAYDIYVSEENDALSGFAFSVSVPIGLFFVGLSVWLIIDNIMDYRRSIQ